MNRFAYDAGAIDEPGIWNRIMSVSGIGAGLIAVCLLGFSSSVLAETAAVTVEEWARPRSGKRIVELEQLKGVVHYLDQHPQAVLTIRFSGGDEGLLWAEELRGWFVALGVAGKRIALSPGLERKDRIILRTE